MQAPDVGAAKAGRGLSPGPPRYLARVAPNYSEGELDAAIDALTSRERFREAEAVVTAAAPKLQRVLAEALETGGWFGDAHEGEIRKAAAASVEEERLTALRTLLAEEARMGMMVGVAVGWALAQELHQTDESNEED
jgi:hypothetical protein